MRRLIIRIEDWHFYRGYRKARKGRTFGVKVLKVVSR